MNWSEFKDTYKWTLRHYPGTFGLFNGDYVVNMTTQRYEKKGSRWILTEEECEKAKEVVFYMNCVDAVPFFRGISARETVTMGYTKAGYIPVEIRTISPDRTQKIVRKFEVYDRFRPDKSLEYLGF